MIEESYIVEDDEHGVTNLTNLATGLKIADFEDVGDAMKAAWKLSKLKLDWSSLAALRRVPGTKLATEIHNIVFGCGGNRGTGPKAVGKQVAKINRKRAG